MSDKLTPGMRADVLELLMAYRDLSDGCVISRVSEFREEAARREAEASNPCKDPGACEVGGCLSPSACQAAAGEREGPGSAAAPNAWRRKCPRSNVMCESPECREHGCQAMRSGLAVVPEDKPTPAADDFAHSLRSVTTVDHRWDAHALSIIRRYENDRHRAADAIDAANAEASSCAAAYKASEARVRELEARLFPYADAPTAGFSWNGFNWIGDDKSIAELRRTLNRSAQVDTYQAAFDERIRAEKARADKLAAALQFYANPEIYKPHPHGPAFDRRDLSFHAVNALKETP